MAKSKDKSKGKSNGKIFLFQWDEKSAAERAAELIDMGWQVELEFKEGSRGCKNLKAFSPNVVVLDIAKKPSHSREVGRALRQAKSFREVPFIFVDGSQEDVAKVREKVPAAIFTTSSRLSKDLENHAL